VWLNGIRSLDGLVEAHERAAAVGWQLPADVFATHHGSWLKAHADGAATSVTIERWFEHSFARKLVDDAGIPAGPAAEWSNMNRDPALLVDVQLRLRSIGSDIAVVWRQHKSRPPADTAWTELKEADNRFRKGSGHTLE